MNLYVMVGDKPQGPLSLDQLRGLMREGKVNMQTLAWMDGQSEWVPLGSIASVVAELFPPLPNGTTPAVEPRTTPSSQPPVPDPVASSSTPANGVTTSSIDGEEMFALVALLVLVAVYLLAGPWSHYKVGLLIGTAIAMQPMGSSRQPRIRNGLLGFGIAQLAVAGIYYFGIHSDSLPMTGEAARTIASATSISPQGMRAFALGVISLVIWLAIFMSTQCGQRSNTRTG
jgi:hypothetical protein